MALKLIKRFTSDEINCEVRVVYDREYQEYQCRLALGGEAKPYATYHTDDRIEALVTAQLMVKQIESR